MCETSVRVNYLVRALASIIFISSCVEEQLRIAMRQMPDDGAFIWPMAMGPMAIKPIFGSHNLCL